MPKKKVVKSKRVARGKKVAIPIKWNTPDNIITRFATNMVVQLIENDFKISFYEQNPPLQLNPNEPIPKEIPATCVASVIVTADRLPRFIKALEDHYKMWIETIKPNK